MINGNDNLKHQLTMNYIKYFLAMACGGMAITQGDVHGFNMIFESNKNWDNFLNDEQSGSSDSNEWEIDLEMASFRERVGQASPDEVIHMISEFMGSANGLYLSNIIFFMNPEDITTIINAFNDNQIIDIMHFIFYFGEPIAIQRLIMILVYGDRWSAIKDIISRHPSYLDNLFREHMECAMNVVDFREEEGSVSGDDTVDSED
jgi:hypothetical protein